MRNNNRRSSLNRLNADINVVPYIDVMLVLLVIFMITAPLLTQGINVHLPNAKGKAISTKKEPIILSIDQKGNYFLNNTKQPSKAITKQQLLSTIYAIMHKDKKNSPAIYVKGDKDVEYGKIVTAMSLLQKAGATQIGLFTQPPTDTLKGRAHT
jgi:biopolymer transport protein TolR